MTIQNKVQKFPWPLYSGGQARKLRFKQNVLLSEKWPRQQLGMQLPQAQLPKPPTATLTVEDFSVECMTHCIVHAIYTHMQIQQEYTILWSCNVHACVISSSIWYSLLIVSRMTIIVNGQLLTTQWTACKSKHVQQCNHDDYEWAP